VCLRLGRRWGTDKTQQSYQSHCHGRRSPRRSPYSAFQKTTIFYRKTNLSCGRRLRQRSSCACAVHDTSCHCSPTPSTLHSRLFSDLPILFSMCPGFQILPEFFGSNPRAGLRAIPFNGRYIQNQLVLVQSAYCR
jgi:hypothetical protein